MDKNDKILITGGNGQLGFDCKRELLSRGYTNARAIDIADLDITDKDAVLKYINEYQPKVVMHNAAWTAVDKAEQFPDKVHQVNVVGTQNIAEACKRAGCKMVYISTDYVFDGKGDTPFEVDSKKGGLSIYGKTKSLGEDAVLSLVEKHFIVRISWAFGLNGNNFVRAMLRFVESGRDEINVVCDQIGSVTYTRDLARLLVDMIETDKYGVYHATNEGFLSWADFADKIFEYTGNKIKVNHITTAEYFKLVPSQADRPLNSRLSKASLDKAGFKRLPPWEDALKRYLLELKEAEK